MITLRKHKDDPEMIEILSERPVSKRSPKGGVIVWGVVHSDIVEDLLGDEEGLVNLFEQEGCIDVKSVLGE